MDMILLVFEEHQLDSTTTDITTALLIYIIDNVIVLSDLVESSGYILQKHFKRIMSICASGRGFTVYHTYMYYVNIVFREICCCMH